MAKIRRTTHSRHSRPGKRPAMSMHNPKCQHGNKTRTAITDDIIERWAEDAEQGIYHGEAGELTINKAIGRPALYEEAMIPITIRILKSLEPESKNKPDTPIPISRRPHEQQSSSESRHKTNNSPDRLNTTPLTRRIWRTDHQAASEVAPHSAYQYARHPHEPNAANRNSFEHAPCL